MKNMKEIFLALAITGLSFAMPGMMGGPRGSMDGAAAGGGGLPLLEVGIGLVILAALIWWFDLRKKGKQ